MRRNRSEHRWIADRVAGSKRRKRLRSRAWKMFGEFIQPVQQTLQGGPAYEVKSFADVFVEGGTVVLGIIDIEADVEYVLFPRRLRFSCGVVATQLFKGCIYNDSPRYS